MGRARSFLELIDAVDNVPADFDYADFYRLLLPMDQRTHGFLTPETVAKMPWTNCFITDHGSRTVQLEAPQDAANIQEYCNKAFQDLIDDAIEKDCFEIVHKSHSEHFLIMGSRVGTVLVERFTAGLFGIATRGAHCTAYSLNSKGEYQIWVPRRAQHLFSYPGKLDTTVAGGVKAQHTPFQCIVEEADEEAALDRDFVSKAVKAVGVITYMTRSARTGSIHPDVLYVYDLELPASIVPKPHDEEVSEFKLMSVDEIKAAMFAGEFKDNCNLVMIDFFLRHGIITPEDEPNYVDLQTRLHRRLPIPISP